MPHSAGDGLIPIDARVDMLRVIIERAREQIAEHGRWEWAVVLGLKGDIYEPILANGRPLKQDRMYDWIHRIPAMQEEWALFQADLGLTFRDRISANLPAAVDSMFEVVFNKREKTADRINAFNSILRTSQALGVFKDEKQAPKETTNNVIAFINQYQGTVNAQNGMRETLVNSTKKDAEGGTEGKTPILDPLLGQSPPENDILDAKYTVLT